MAAFNDFLNMLHEDHLKVMDLLDQLKEMPDRDMSRRAEMFDTLKSAMIPHMRAEEKTFYLVLRQNNESKMDAMLAMEEHHVAELTMLELYKMSKDEEFWAPKLMVFRELINHHIKDEESKVFKDVRDHISQEQMQGIKQDFMYEKESAMTKAKMSSTH